MSDDKRLCPCCEREYLTSEISSMCEDDELILKAENLIEELNDF